MCIRDRILEVPNEKVKLTDYPVWADFMFAMKYTNKSNYHKISMVSSETEVSQKMLDKMIRSLKEQKRPGEYKIPQAVMEEIRPEWLVKYKLHPHDPFGKIRRIFNSI